MSLGPQPATVTNSIFALGLEPFDGYGHPRGPLTSYDFVPPVAADLGGGESDSQQVNRSGYARAGVPGPKGGPVEWQFPLRSGAWLEHLHHLAPAATKNDLGGGAYEYTFSSQFVGGVQTSYYGLLAKPPAEAVVFHGARFSGLEFDIGNDSSIVGKLTGLNAHGTSAGFPEVQSGSLYTLGPLVRGLVLDPDAGDIYLEITRDTAGGGVQFKFEQTLEVPTFPAPAAIDLYTSAGLGAWQQLPGIGLYGLVVDPFEVIFPGAAATHAALAIGDRWRIPAAAVVPATVVPPSEGHDYTSAHWQLLTGTVDTVADTDLAVLSGACRILRPVSADPQNGSLYPRCISADGRFGLELDLKRRLVDDYFKRVYDRKTRISLRTEFLGAPIAASGFYESIRIDGQRWSVTERTSAVSGQGKIDEDIKLRAETNDAGDPPGTIRVVSARDWSIPVLP